MSGATAARVRAAGLRPTPAVLLVLVGALGLASPGGLRGQAGSVAGTVTLDGHPPEPPPVEVTSDRGYCGDTLRQRRVRVRDGGVANAVVWIEGAEGAPEPGRRTLENRGCRFEPRVLAAAVGDTLVVSNRDSLLHNTNLEQTYTRGELAGHSRTLANFSLPLAGMEVAKPNLLRAPGRIAVTCDAHGWMEARVRVFDHPHFAVTGPEGGFAIEGVPPGTHSLHVRHDVLGSIEREVTVEPDGETRVDATLAPGQ